MPNIKDAQIDAVQFNDLSADPDAPAAGRIRLFFKNALPYFRRASGEVQPLGGSPLTMNIVTYTGNGQSNRAVSGFGFAPDAVIILMHTASNYDVFFASRLTSFSSRVVNVNLVAENLITSWDSDGFHISEGSQMRTNYSGFQYVVIGFRINP